MSSSRNSNFTTSENEANAGMLEARWPTVAKTPWCLHHEL